MKQNGHCEFSRNWETIGPALLDLDVHLTRSECEMGSPERTPPPPRGASYTRHLFSPPGALSHQQCAGRCHDTCHPSSNLRFCCCKWSTRKRLTVELPVFVLQTRTEIWEEAALTAACVKPDTWTWAKTILG